MLIDSNSEKVSWAIIEGSYTRSGTEIGKNEFILAMSKSHETIETQGIFSGSLPHILKALFGFDA